MKTFLCMLLLVSQAHGQAKTAPPQGAPPRNLNQQADGHYTANGEPANPATFEVYTVKRGDTLSMIARSVLKDPGLWPQLWEQNAHIVNPHWIYPDDRILIRPLTAITGAAPPSAGGNPGSAPAAGAPSLPPSPPREPLAAAGRKDDLLFTAAATTPAPEIKITDLYCSGFILKTRLPTAMKVTARYNADGGALAVASDYIYVSAGGEDGVRAGDMYQVVRPTRTVKSTRGGTKADRDLGMHYLHIAQIQVVLTQADFSMARVVQACEAVEIGDIMFPFEKSSVPALPRARPFSPFMTSSGELQGAIVMTRNALINFGSTFSTSGQIPGARTGSLEGIRKGVATTGDIVYVDIGEPTGVKPGDLFIVFRAVDIDPQLYKLPPEAKRVGGQKTAVGELVILRVDEKASSALVTYSPVGLLAGDFVSRR